MAANQFHSAQSIEIALKQALGVNQPTANINQLPPSGQGNPEQHQVVTPVEAATHVAPYDNYIQEIMCFTASPEHDAGNLIREFVTTLCQHQNTKVFTSQLQLPASDIPSGKWSIGFASSVLGDGVWALAFAAPRDSEYVWVWWPEKAGSEDQVMDFLKRLREEGRIQAEDGMGVGGSRHKRFHALVGQALWRAETMEGLDFMSGEFSGVAS